MMIYFSRSENSCLADVAQKICALAKKNLHQQEREAKVKAESEIVARNLELETERASLKATVDAHAAVTERYDGRRQPVKMQNIFCRHHSGRCSWYPSTFFLWN
jgi:hypothetical protein